MSDQAHRDLPAGAELVGGHAHVRDGKGRLVPLELVKAQDRLQDATVRELFAKAEAAAAAIAAFKVEAFETVDAFLQLLLEQYRAQPAGEKGNVSLTTYDGLLKVQVQRADVIEFGAELQAAKALIDECLKEWSADSRAEIRAIVLNAFDTSKTGKINRGALLGLLRLDIADERWGRAMQAIRDSMRVVDVKPYIRFHRRARPTDPWTKVALDIASA